MILLGSRAAKARHSDFRDPADWDIVSTLDELVAWAAENRPNIRLLMPSGDGKYRARLDGGIAIEFDLRSGSNDLLRELTKDEFEVPIPGGVAKVPSTVILALTKRSHALWPIHWNKTIRDYHTLRSLDPREPTKDEWSYHNMRRSEVETRHDIKAKNLDVSNDEFFARSEKAVQRRVPHDSLHEVVAYGERPLFERFKRDINKAKLDRDLFEAAEDCEKLRLVREEAMVIALERAVIPSWPVDSVDPQEAYAMALKRLCTSLTSGWFRDFAIDRWAEINVPDIDYVARFRNSRLGELLSNDHDPRSYV